MRNAVPETTSNDAPMNCRLIHAPPHASRFESFGGVGFAPTELSPPACWVSDNPHSLGEDANISGSRAEAAVT